MHSTVMLISDDLRDGPEVDLSSGNYGDVQDFRHWGESGGVMSHCAESVYVLRKSFLYVALKEDGVHLSQSGDSLCH